MSDCEMQGREFIAKHKITFLATEYPEECQKNAPWAGDGPCGLRYRIKLIGNVGRVWRGRELPKRLQFDFWGSINDRKAIEKIRRKDVCHTREELYIGVRSAPTPYSVLSCISCDINCPDTFHDFCAEYDYEEDSRSAERLFRRCRKFAAKLRKFFTAEQIADLQEIQ